jgi:hypothetical protein
MHFSAVPFSRCHSHLDHPSTAVIGGRQLLRPLQLQGATVRQAPKPTERPLAAPAMALIDAVAPSRGPRVVLFQHFPHLAAGDFLAVVDVQMQGHGVVGHIRVGIAQ